MWIRINDIPMGDMPENQEQWVESQAGDGDQFVSIEDGDKDSAEAAQLQAQGCEERKGYFSDQAVFTC